MGAWEERTKADLPTSEKVDCLREDLKMKEMVGN